MDTLPPDVMGRLCSLLSGGDIATLGATCWKWRGFVWRNDVWKLACEREGLAHTGSYEPVWRAIYILKKSAQCLMLPSHAFNFVHNLVSEQKMLVTGEVLQSEDAEQRVLFRVGRVLYHQTADEEVLRKFPSICTPGAECYLHRSSCSFGKGTQVLLILTTWKSLHYDQLKNPHPTVPSVPLNYWCTPHTHAAGYLQLAIAIHSFRSLFDRWLATARVDDVFTRFYFDELVDFGVRDAKDSYPAGECSRCKRSVGTGDHFFVKSDGQEWCTYHETGPRFIQQAWYKCTTCWPAKNAQEGICAPCSRICHVGHALVLQRSAPFYCDCGASPNCKSKELEKICGDCARVTRYQHALSTIEWPFSLKLPKADAQRKAAHFVMQFVQDRVLAPFGRAATNISTPVVQHVYCDSIKANRLVHVTRITFDAAKVMDMPPLEPSIESNRKYLRDVNEAIFLANVLEVWILDCGIIRKWKLDGPFVRAWTATQAKTDWIGIKETAFHETQMSLGGMGISGIFDITTGNTTDGMTGCCHTGTYVGSHGYNLSAGHRAWRVEQFMAKPMIVYEYVNRMVFSDINDY